jgi:predicted DNA-binding transcriptional regulator AlpA
MHSRTALLAESAAFTETTPPTPTEPATISPAPSLRRFLRKREVLQATGLSNSELYRLMKLGMFPLQVKLSAEADARTGAWDAVEIAQWQSDRLAARNAD